MKVFLNKDSDLEVILKGGGKLLFEPKDEESQIYIQQTGFNYIIGGINSNNGCFTIPCDEVLVFKNIKRNIIKLNLQFV